jgi:hypothetical protein
MSLIPGEPPLVHAPTFEGPRFVPWFTRADLDYLSQFEFGPSINMAACDLATASLRPELAHRIRDSHALGLALHPQLHLLQVPGDEHREHYSAEIERLSAPIEVSFDPIAELMPDDAAVALAEHLIDLAIEAWATGLLVGSFLVTEPSLAALDNNLALLAASARYFHEEGLAAGADERVRFSRPRQLFATISVERRVLRDAGFMSELLEAYIGAGAGVYGFWVQVANIGSLPHPADVRVISDFMYELKRRTNKPVVPDRFGQLGLGYLAGGLSYCVGTGAPEYLTFPPFVPPKRAGDEKPKGFSLVAYHAPSMRNFITQGKHSGRAGRAFQIGPCACGFHPRNEPPRGNKVKKLHCFRSRVDQALDVLSGSLDENVAVFLNLLARAEDQSKQIDGNLSMYAALRETLPPDVAERVGRGTTV